MFTQPCFIRKNSKELAKKLQNIGYYTYHVEEYEDAPPDWCTVTEIEADYAGIRNNEPKGEYAKRCIDCGTNERLFLAIAAIRNDTDKHQLFVNNNNGEFFKCYENEFSHFRFDTNDILKIANAIENGSSPCLGKPLVLYEDTKNWHKATVEELIEHFKDK